MDTTSMQLTWKGTQSTPGKELSRLSQFAGAYAEATIHKATNIESLIMEKGKKMTRMEQSFFNEKQRIEQELQ